MIAELQRIRAGVFGVTTRRRCAGQYQREYRADGEGDETAMAHNIAPWMRDQIDHAALLPPHYEDCL